MAWPKTAHLGERVMAKGHTWPRPGMPRDNGQVEKNQKNAEVGPERRLVGGGGMAVGPLRSAKGVALHPKAAREALVRGMKGC